MASENNEVVSQTTQDHEKAETPRVGIFFVVAPCQARVS